MSDQVLQITSATHFTTTETETDTTPITREATGFASKQVTGDALTALLAVAGKNAGATACSNSEFVENNGNTTKQPNVSVLQDQPIEKRSSTKTSPMLKMGMASVMARCSGRAAPTSSQDNRRPPCPAGRKASLGEPLPICRSRSRAT